MPAKDPARTRTVALSARGAQSCEEAIHETCVCRCGGRYHGGKRGNVCDLDSGDPHFIGKACAVCTGTGECSYCDGRGARTYGYVGETPLKCVYCDGSGKCRKCGGTGFMFRKGARETADQVMKEARQ